LLQVLEFDFPHRRTFTLDDRPKQPSVESPCATAETLVAKLEFPHAACGAEGYLPMVGDDFGAVVLAVEAFMEETYARKTRRRI
jgi:hypothetical protein